MSLCEAIEDTGVSLQKFRLYLLSLSVFENKHEHEQPILLENVKDQIKNADSINEIFTILTTDCCSFMNDSIFQTIIDKYGISTDANEDLQYSKHLKAYLENHKISEFILINPKLERFPKDSEKVILKFNVALPNNITKVLDLRSAIAEILGLRLPALQLVAIEEGCVVITFCIPTCVADHIFANGLTSQQEADIQALSVLWLKCGNYKLEEIPRSAGKDFNPSTLSQFTNSYYLFFNNQCEHFWTPF